MSRWTLETAGAILPDVRRRTEEAFQRVEALSAEREAVAPDSPRGMQIGLRSFKTPADLRTADFWRLRRALARHC